MFTTHYFSSAYFNSRYYIDEEFAIICLGGKAYVYIKECKEKEPSSYNSVAEKLADLKEITDFISTTPEIFEIKLINHEIGVNNKENNFYIEKINAKEMIEKLKNTVKINRSC